MLSGGAAEVASRDNSHDGVGQHAKDRKDENARQGKDKQKDRKDKQDKDKKDKKNKTASPGESRPGRNDDDPRLVRWDVNGDGVLSRAEWKAAPELFNRLDVNRDEVLTRSELAEHP